MANTSAEIQCDVVCGFMSEILHLGETFAEGCADSVGYVLKEFHAKYCRFLISGEERCR